MDNVIPKAKWLARDEDGSVWSIGLHRYGRRSVWAGREQFFKLENFASMDEARARHPRLNVQPMPFFD